MWTEITRPKYERRGGIYAGDLMDAEWELIAPLFSAAKRLGRRRTDLREVVNALLYMARTGCQWRLLPEEFPPRSTVQRYFYAWRRIGLWAGIKLAPLMRVREREGREASSSAGVIPEFKPGTT